MNQKNNQEYYRHGDLLFVKVDTVPDEFSRFKQEPKAHSRGVIVAEGEKTGHHHTLDAVTEYYNYEFGNDGRISFVKIEKETKLEHEEHGLITLPPGTYQINFQRELNGANVHYPSTSSLIDQARQRVRD